MLSGGRDLHVCLVCRSICSCIPDSRASLRPHITLLLGLAWKSSHTSYIPAYEDGRDGVPKRRHIEFRSRVITQKKAYNIQNTAKLWNQDITLVLCTRFLNLLSVIKLPYSLLFAVSALMYSISGVAEGQNHVAVHFYFSFRKCAVKYCNWIFLPIVRSRHSGVVQVIFLFSIPIWLATVNVQTLPP